MTADGEPRLEGWMDGSPPRDLVRRYRQRLTTMLTIILMWTGGGLALWDWPWFGSALFVLAIPIASVVCRIVFLGLPAPPGLD